MERYWNYTFEVGGKFTVTVYAQSLVAATKALRGTWTHTPIRVVSITP